MRPYDLIIPANGQRTIRVSGNYAVIKNADGLVNMYTPDGRLMMRDVEVTQGFRNVPFVDLVVEDASGAQNAVTIIVAQDAEVIDVVRLAGSVNIAPSTSHTYGRQPVGTASLLLGGAAGQRRITLRADKANTASVTVGTTAGNGVFLDAGDTYTIDTSAAITLVAASGTQQIHWHAEF